MIEEVVTKRKTW